MPNRFGRVVAIAVLAAVALSAQTARAQLGFQINPTQGFPGDVVNGQVNPADVAANCTTTVEAFSARFQALFDGPFVQGNTAGELPERFFPDPNSFTFENTAQMAYVMDLFVLLALATNTNGAAAGALPQTFVMTFAEIATQTPIGQRGSFDPVTGVGSVTVPDLPPSLQAIAATCVGPVVDVDALEQAVRDGAAFLDSIGIVFGPDGVTSQEFFDWAAGYLGSSSTGFDLLTEFITAVGPDLLFPMMAPDALGLQLFTVLPPSPIDIKTANAWRTRDKPARIIIKGSLQTGQFGANDTLAPPTDFTLHITDAGAMNVTVAVDADTCATSPKGTILCQDAARTYRVSFAPVKTTPGKYNVEIRLRQLDFSAPQVGPITLEFEYGIPRKGVASSCKVDAAKLACRG